MSDLATMSDLPDDYRAHLKAAQITPLWPNIRNMLPPDVPSPQTMAHHWRYEDVRPLLMQAGEFTPIEKAERRVLVLSDPGRGDAAMQTTATIYCGMQLLLPGESAPAHRHTPSAARIIVEGEGGYTVVDREKCPMERGDVVLTPGGCWHDHGHEGSRPVVWLDALDLPIFVAFDGCYSQESALQTPMNRPDSALVEYRAAGLVPSGACRPAKRYPLVRYPWTRTEEALRALMEYSEPSNPAELDYVNPDTGESCLPTLGFTAMGMRAGTTLVPPLRSCSAVFHVVSGRGRSRVGDHMFEWNAGDSFSAPVFAAIRHEATSEAFLIRIHDAPLQQKLGYYEERPL